MHNFLMPVLLVLFLVACGKGREEKDDSSGPATDVSAVAVQTEESPVGRAVANIDAADLLEHIRVLSSDEFGGRAPMSEGERLTLLYLETRFRDLGLAPMFGDSYRQPVPLISIEAVADTPLGISGRGGSVELSYAYGPEVMFWTTRKAEEIGLHNSELVWVGYGIVAPEYDWNDYEGVDVAGKTVVILVNDPGFATRDPERFKGKRMTYYGRWTYKYEEAARQGAAGALIIHETEPAAYGWNVVEDSNKGPQFHLADDGNETKGLQVEGWVQHHVAEEIFAHADMDLGALESKAAESSVTPTPLGLNASLSFRNRLGQAESFNVGAVRLGSERLEEIFIYMAHWDHLGTAAHEEDAAGDFIYNGAEDNASGTAGLLEIAEAFAAFPEAPDRTIGFLAMTAEESGLLGSKAYVERPAWPLRQTVGGINMDRLNFRGKMSDIVVIGRGSSELEEILANEAALTFRDLASEAAPEKGYFYRSDHFNFAKKGVPVLFARGGTTDREHGAEYVSRREAKYIAERYHRPADEIQEDWVLEGAVEDLRLFFHVGLRLANSTEWPEWYEGNEFRAIREESLAAE